MKSLKDYILQNNKWLQVDENDSFIIEGIKIDDVNKKVRLDDSDEGVDFNGPVYWKTDEGIDAISIFKRKPLKIHDKEFDGNPFIHALKGKYKWKFDITRQEIIKYLKKFISNCEKLQKKYDTIIMIPSTSQINKRFMDELYNILDAEYKIENLFKKIKLNHDEIEQFIDYEQIEKDYTYPRYVEMEIEDILYKLNGTNKEFQAKEIDKTYLKYIKFLQINDDPNTVEKINGKNILVLDDVFSSGSTLFQAVNAIKQNYNPKSIELVTLLSKTFKN